MAWLWLLVGPNGSGKTTLARSGTLQTWSPAIPVFAQSPDDIARVLPSVVPDADEWAYVRAAQAASDSLVLSAVNAGRTIMVETVGSSPKFVPVIDQAMSRGMRFGLIYVTVDTEALNVARVAERVARGGHDVPTNFVLARRANSIAAFPGFASRADAGLVLDNSQTDRASKRPKPRILAEKQLGGRWQVLDASTAPYLTDALADLT